MEDTLPKVENPHPILDRALGMLHGVALGDALGAPHEFRNLVPLRLYTGILEHPYAKTCRWKGRRTGVPGQVTDDTEMTIALLRSLKREDDGSVVYYRDMALLGYLGWANSGSVAMGKNTRLLLHGVKTARGYNGRRTKNAISVAATQSNGCLMRSAPLALVHHAAGVAADEEGGGLEAARIDCELTNPNPVCLVIVGFHVGMLQCALAGGSVKDVIRLAKQKVGEHGLEHGLLLTAYLDAKWDAHYVLEPADVEEPADNAEQPDTDVPPLPRVVTGQDKGWVVHAFYSVIYAAYLFKALGRFEDCIDAVIKLGGDTDTNGAIAGALLGALVGNKELQEEDRTGQNLDILLGANPGDGVLNRPPEYHPRELGVLLGALLD